MRLKFENLTYVVSVGISKISVLIEITFHEKQGRNMAAAAFCLTYATPMIHILILHIFVIKL